MMEDIRTIGISQIEEYLRTIGEKPFRARQIWTWLWQKGAGGFDEMSDLSLSLRSQLGKQFTFHRAGIIQEVHSKDGTTKFAVQFADGKMVECVTIPSRCRVTACISSQIGCPLHCTFCATGRMGFIRNLHYSEIIDEYILMHRQAERLYGNGISNIVMMGMGEPLLNYENVIAALDLLTGKEEFGLSPARITLSTAGIIKGIKALADNKFSCGLAVSLHSVDPVIREAIMPVTKLNSLHDLQNVLLYYYQKTGRRVTLEYLLLDHVNDSQHDAERLARFCRPFPVKINIIEYNETGDGPYRRTDSGRREIFIQVLRNCNMVVNVRQSRGQDIAAACGQLLKSRQHSS